MTRSNAMICVGLLGAGPGVAFSLSAQLQDSFDAGPGQLVAIGVDESTGHVYTLSYAGYDIQVLAADGTLLYTIPPPPGSGNDIDLDVALASVDIGGTIVPAGALLVFNGDVRPERLYGVDVADGTVLASVVLETVSTVGGAHLPGDGTVVSLDYTTDEIRVLDPADGSALAVLAPELPFDVFFGDIDYLPASDTLLVVSSELPIIRELDTAGYCMRDIDVSSLGITELSGVAIDEVRGDYWLASTTGTVYRVRLSPTPVDADTDGWFDEED